MESVNESFVAKSARIFTVVAMYWAVSISMVFLNAYLLNNNQSKLDAPLFVTWWQCVIAVVFCFVCGTIGQMFPRAPFFGSFPAFEIDREIAKKFVPLSMVFVGMITFNNLTLKYVGMQFYNVGRSLTTVFNVVLSFVVLQQSTSAKALACCGLIVLGFFIGVFEEMGAKTATDSSQGLGFGTGDKSGLSFVGIACGLLASSCVALYAIIMKKLFPLVGGNAWKMTLYNNFNAVILFIPLIMINGENEEVRDFPGLWTFAFWFAMSMGGLMGVGIAIVSANQVQATSPLTHNISGTAKACAQTVLAVFLNSQYRSFWWWTSNFVVLGSSAAYAHVKREEMRAKDAEKKRKDAEEMHSFSSPNNRRNDHP